MGRQARTCPRQHDQVCWCGSRDRRGQRQERLSPHSFSRSNAVATNPSKLFSEQLTQMEIYLLTILDIVGAYNIFIRYSLEHVLSSILNVSLLLFNPVPRWNERWSHRTMVSLKIVIIYIIAQFCFSCHNMEELIFQFKIGLDHPWAEIISMSIWRGWGSSSGSLGIHVVWWQYAVSQKPSRHAPAASPFQE